MKYINKEIRYQTTWLIYGWTWKSLYYSVVEEGSPAPVFEKREKQGWDRSTISRQPIPSVESKTSLKVLYVTKICV